MTEWYREVNEKEIEERMKVKGKRGREWKVKEVLFAEYKVSRPEWREALQRILDEFRIMCDRLSLKIMLMRVIPVG